MLASVRLNDNDMLIRALVCIFLMTVGTAIAHAKAAEHQQCKSIPGLESEDIAKARFLIFGESHGTTEVPAFVGQVACLLSTKRPVVVALEIDDVEQPNTDAYLNSAGTADDIKRFVTSGTWGGQSQWGVTSVAMFRLIERIRALRQSGRNVTIVNFKSVNLSGNTLHQDYYEIRMAAQLALAAETHPDAIIVALMGNIHARKSAITLSKTQLSPAVSHLPARDVLTFNAANTGGSAWQCREEGCRAFEFSGGSVSKPLGLYRSQEGNDAFDGEYSVGKPFTASPPAATGIPGG